MQDGKVYQMTIPGDGRVSVGRNPRTEGFEARFYRNQTTKAYDAFIPQVMAVWSDKVVMAAPVKTPEEIAREEEYEVKLKEMTLEAEKARMERVTEAIVRKAGKKSGVASLFEEPEEMEIPTWKGLR